MHYLTEPSRGVGEAVKFTSGIDGKTLPCLCSYGGTPTGPDLEVPPIIPLGSLWPRIFGSDQNVEKERENEEGEQGEAAEMQW